MKAITLSDEDLIAMDTINHTIDQIMELSDEEYMEASEKVLGIVRRYLASLTSPLQDEHKPLIFDIVGGRA